MLSYLGHCFYLKNFVHEGKLVPRVYANFIVWDLSNDIFSLFMFNYADTKHQFNARESDWGFTSFMPLSDLYDPSRGYLVNDTCIVEAEVLVRKVLDYWSYDSKKETGYVGLKNQGATCYMNSLLQTLYHIPYFRKVGKSSIALIFGLWRISQFLSLYPGCLPYADNRE